MASVKKNSEVPSYALIFAADLINACIITAPKKVFSTIIVKKLSSFTWWLPHLLSIRPRSSSTKWTASSLEAIYFFFRFSEGSARARERQAVSASPVSRLQSCAWFISVSRRFRSTNLEKRETARSLSTKLIMKTNKIRLFVVFTTHNTENLKYNKPYIN